MWARFGVHNQFGIPLPFLGIHWVNGLEQNVHSQHAGNNGSHTKGYQVTLNVSLNNN